MVTWANALLKSKGPNQSPLAKPAHLLDAGKVHPTEDPVEVPHNPDDHESRPILVVYHSRSGTTKELLDSFLLGMSAGSEASNAEIPQRVLRAFDAGPEDVLGARGIVLVTPANFGYMSGALKDFFERTYHLCLGKTVGLPYVLVVKGDTDVEGAVTSVEKIVSGLEWRRVLPLLRVVGPLTSENREEAFELGATFAAGVASDIF